MAAAELDPADPAEEPTPLTAGNVVIDQRCQIVGSVLVDGDVWLTGEIEGDLRCRNAHVGATGHVGGVVVAERAVVNGEVLGAIYSNTIELKGGANVEGDIFHEKLILDGGSYFEGRSRRHADPQSLAPAVPTPARALAEFNEMEPTSPSEPGSEESADRLVRPVEMMNPFHG